MIFAGWTFTSNWALQSWPLQKLRTPEAGQLREEDCSKRSFQLGCLDVKKYDVNFEKKILRPCDDEFRAPLCARFWRHHSNDL
jgi:hypothetical protein